LREWLFDNGLSFNPSKNGVTQFSTGRGGIDLLDGLSVSGIIVEPSSNVKSLGVMLD
jgi:hypothetical protein